MSEPVEAGAADEGAPPAARRLVLGALALLLTAGLVGFDAWPLTAWRLFSLARGDRQTEWLLEATTSHGPSRTLSLEDLPLRYRHAAWPMAELPKASAARREDVCRALLEPATDVVADLEALSLVRDRQRLVHRGGEWVVTHDPEVVHTCLAEVGE